VDDFEGFFSRHYGPTVRAISLAIGDSGRAEDLTQEAFARAYRRWSTVSKLERPVAWVYVVALNAERKRWRREVDRPEAEAPGVDSPDLAGGVLTKIVVRDALDRLPPRQRAAVVLRYLADLTVTDIAEVMACAEGTVKATLHHALRNLRVELDGSEP
jgi:RNA polymerase sigma-70 factor, ECF subfamily